MLDTGYWMLDAGSAVIDDITKHSASMDYSLVNTAMVK
jgi:hypothetical protein